MGHASSTYLLQASEFNGFYKNKYKPNGKGIKYTKWKTIDGRMSLNDAKKLWLELYQQRDPAKITRHRVRYKGQTVIDHQGRVYEKWSDSEKYMGTKDTWMRFVEELV